MNDDEDNEDNKKDEQKTKDEGGEEFFTKHTATGRAIEDRPDFDDDNEDDSF